VFWGMIVQILKMVALVIGVLAILMGLLWIGQGTGLVRWPETSFMIDQSRWTYNGAILAAVGLLTVVFARR